MACLLTYTEKIRYQTLAFIQNYNTKLQHRNPLFLFHIWEILKSAKPRKIEFREALEHRCSPKRVGQPVE